LPLSDLAPKLFPFFRHTIPTVRLAVVETLHSFMNVASLPKDWVATPLLRLFFQNLVVEERTDIRDATIAAWNTAIDLLRSQPGWMEIVITSPQVLEWFETMMTPMGFPIDASGFYDPLSPENGAQVAAERHNVDKNMLAQDLTLVSPDSVWKARIAVATAMAYLIASWNSSVCFDPHISGITFLRDPRPIVWTTFSNQSFSTMWIRAVCCKKSSLPL
jgi:TATA-binding protein-associated factor